MTLEHGKATYKAEDYSFVTVFHQGRIGSDEYADYVSEYLAESADTDYERGMELIGWPEKNLPCAHCGARFKFGAILRYKPTGAGIVVGRTCYRKDFEQVSSKAAYDFRALVKVVAKARKAAAFWELVGADKAAFQVENRIIKNIVRTGERFGKVSKGQRELVLKIATELADVPEIVEGRQVITGTVVKVAEKRNYTNDGFDLKMTVKDDRGFLVWGSVPASISSVVVGDGVKFTATVSKGSDKAFGFFKRPSKAEVK